ncbi:MAG: glutamate--tRNA ligase [Phycisphaerae bacterium]|jgi:glutamyl-tRNA synthetase|nr:glutamate--tRNA ligase [Phycisphaerae bacterium]
MDKLNTRFPPSPTGYLHVGGARTALFAFVMARKTGGQFVLRIEDTDRARHDESAVDKIIEDLRWLGIDWDQGPDIGGPNGPYRQSERLDIYRDHVDKLLTGGKAYYAFDTSEELEKMRAEAQDAKLNFHYPRPDPLPSTADAENARQAGRPVVVRFLCPEGDVTISDDAFGQVTMPADQTDDFIILKADSYPTYHLANVIDDAMMGVNYIMRGQEFLGQSWRHKVLREALDFDEPQYCHLPLIMDTQGRKLAKRDGDVEVFAFRQAGYLPETMVNYLALLGWNPGNDIERFSLEELVELFTPDRVGKTNAKFDRDKLLAFNTDAVAAADPDRLLAGLKDFLAINDTPIPADDDDLLRRILQANKGFRTFADIIAKSGILFDDDAVIEYDPKAVKKWLAKGENAGWTMLAELRDRLADCDWTGDAIEQLIADICEQKEIGMGKVAQPIRVAVTGRAVSPSIGETLIFLGKEKTLRRMDNCLAARP